MDLTELDFQRFQSFLKSSSGIALADNKKYLILNRLEPVLQETGVDSLTDIISIIEAAPSGDLAVNVIDAMTTNETFWFRDESHFKYLEQHLFAELLSKNRSIKVWSAACSSGQESYSISLSADAFFKTYQGSGTIDITATDISDKTIIKAKRGIYADIELERGLVGNIKEEHFSRVREGWQISAAHRARTRFKTFNLLDDFNSLAKFDIIFCRNVLIYFAGPTKVDILNKLRDSLNPSGYLFLSSSEIVPRDVSGFETVRESGAKCYRKT